MKERIKTFFNFHHRNLGGRGGGGEKIKKTLFLPFFLGGVGGEIK